MVILKKKQDLIFIVLLLTLFSNLVTFSCAAREVTDLSGRQVKIPEKINRLVAVGPGSLRMVVYLKAANRVVGVEEFERRNRKTPYNLAHPELADLPLIGPQFGGDAELITAQQPEIIIAAYLTKANLNTLAAKTKIPVVSITSQNADSLTESDFKNQLKFLGDILHQQQRAAELIARFEFHKKYLSSKVAALNPSEKIMTKVYVGGIGNKGAHGICSTESGYLPFKYLDLKTIIAADSNKNITIDKEKLLLSNPGLIFVDTGGLNLVKEDLTRQEFSYLQAYQADNFYQLLPYNYYTTNYATLLANSYYIAKVVYPDLFNDFVPAQKADQIYQEFVGQPVYQKMTAIFGGFKKIQLAKFLK